MIFCINNGGLNEVKTRKGELKQFLIDQITDKTYMKYYH